MMLPRGTWLGELALFEVYADHNGPRLFSVVDPFGKYFLALSTDEEDDEEQWLYVPISDDRLKSLRVGGVDLAEPFRKPEGDFAFHITTYAEAKRASKIEPIHFAKLPEGELPRPGFKLNLKAPPPQWTLDSIRAAETNEMSAHETRLVRRAEAEGLTGAIFVARVIRRWALLLGALSPKIDLHVASVAHGSLRTVFSAPKAKQKEAVESYSTLVDCGDDIHKLRSELRTPQLSFAYYELVHLLAEEKCALELATAKRGTNHLQIHKLTREVAQAQAAGLAEPHVETREREFTASVTAASLSQPSIELKLEDNEIVSGIVTYGASKLTGLQIGSSYRFTIKQLTKTDTPSANPRIEVELHSAQHDEGQFDELPVIQRDVARIKHTKVLEWAKHLSQTDAFRAPSGSVRAYVPLTGSKQGIDAKTFFRQGLFGDLTWSKETTNEEVTTGEFEVRFFGVSMGTQRFDLSHDPTRVRHNNEAPTRLRWNGVLKKLLLQNNAVGVKLTLRREQTGQLLLIVGS